MLLWTENDIEPCMLCDALKSVYEELCVSLEPSQYGGRGGGRVAVSRAQTTTQVVDGVTRAAVRNASHTVVG